jgi:hypothetical protein
VLLGKGDHLGLQLRRAESWMQMQDSLAHGHRMQDSRDLAAGCLPEGGDLVERRADLAILDEMPAPVIEPGDVPAQFLAAVEHKDLAQKAPDAPIVLRAFDGPPRWVHGLLVIRARDSAVR